MFRCNEHTRLSNKPSKKHTRDLPSDRKTDWQTNLPTDKLSHRQTFPQTNLPTDGPTDRQINWQTDQLTDRLRCKALFGGNRSQEETKWFKAVWTCLQQFEAVYSCDQLFNAVSSCLKAFFFFIFFFYVFCFSPTSGILRKHICLSPHNEFLRKLIFVYFFCFLRPAFGCGAWTNT